MGVYRLQRIPCLAGSEYGLRNERWEGFIEFSAGYFLYDMLGSMLLPSEKSGIEKALNYFHHIVSVITHYYPVCVCHYGVALSVTGYIFELSTPFTNARWMLKEAAGGTGTTIYLVNGILMAVFFFVCRMIGCAVLLYMMFVTHNEVTGKSVGIALGEIAPFGGINHVIAPLTCIFAGINCYWMFKIVKVLARQRHF